MNVKSEEKEKYHLNSKGKLAVVLYSLTVAVILSLIVLNTGMLANLKTANAAKEAKVGQYQATIEAQEETLANSDDNVRQWALENDMILG